MAVKVTTNVWTWIMTGAVAVVMALGGAEAVRKAAERKKQQDEQGRKKA